MAPHTAEVADLGCLNDLSTRLADGAAILDEWVYSSTSG